MVASAQATYSGPERGGPRPAGGDRPGNAGKDRQRTILQNKLLHAALSDIADQLPWPPETGELHDVNWWKRRCTLQWLLDERQPVEVITPLEQHQGDEQFALLLPHTSDLNTKQMAAFNEWLFAFGDLHGVTFGKMR